MITGLAFTRDLSHLELVNQFHVVVDCKLDFIFFLLQYAKTGSPFNRKTLAYRLCLEITRVSASNVSVRAQAHDSDAAARPCVTGLQLGSLRKLQ